VDVLTAEQRHRNMSAIRGRETKPEVIVRKYLFSRGLRYRKNDRRYPGHPDIVLPKYRTIVFVNGCFWHQHAGCKYARLPKTNREFWEKKLIGNAERDKRVYMALANAGWHVIVVWECELKTTVRDKTLEDLYHKITDNV
jgi:DNA mismatch endonuclease (patch repair protein)